jgi:hypothetical protein
MSTPSSVTLPKKLVLLPDTNVFIETKDLQQLPWDELATDEITLLVCAAVRKEIDGHKTNERNRVRKRALEWNPEFKKLLRPGAPPLVLRENLPRVTLAMAPPSSGGPAHSSLDLQDPDDQLVDATIKYRDSHLSEDVRLFTDDTGPIGKAYEIGLALIELPADWRRDPGQSEEQKQIDALTRKVKLLEENCPKPSIRFLDEWGKEIKAVQLKVRRYRSLRSDEVEALVNELKGQDPPPTADQLKSQEPTLIHQLFSRAYWRPPSDQSISKFLNEEYPAWLEQIRQLLFQLGTDLGIESSISSFRISLTNIGARPAESVKLTVKTGGHFLLLKDGVQPASLFREPKLPTRPTPPEGTLVDPMMEALEWASSMQQVGGLTSLDQLDPTSFARTLSPLDRRERQKNAWYLEKEQSKTSFTQEKVFTCDEWRHQEDPFEEALSLKFDYSQSTGSNNIVTVILYANNMPEPVKEILKVEATIEHHDVAEYARKLLQLD